MIPSGVSPSHDHNHCIEDALARAEELSAERGLRFTETRRRVLELVWQSHTAVKAYDIIERFSTDGQATKPPTVYRALDFLIEHGFIHRIESLNAFVGCAHPDDGHESQFLICNNCDNVAEINAQGVRLSIRDQADKAGFHIGRQTIEVHGLCGNCSGGN